MRKKNSSSLLVPCYRITVQSTIQANETMSAILSQIGNAWVCLMEWSITSPSCWRMDAPYLGREPWGGVRLGGWEEWGGWRLCCQDNANKKKNGAACAIEWFYAASCKDACEWASMPMTLADSMIQYISKTWPSTFRRIQEQIHTGDIAATHLGNTMDNSVGLNPSSTGSTEWANARQGWLHCGCQGEPNKTLPAPLGSVAGWQLAALQAPLFGDVQAGVWRWRTTSADMYVSFHIFRTLLVAWPRWRVR